MKSPIIYTIFLLLISSTGTLSVAQSEADYINRIAYLWKCDTEVSVANGRVDLVTATHAFEVERAYKWKNSIGQALWYSLQTNKKPGIILIIESREDYKYGIMLNSALEHGGFSEQVRVLYYPEDIER